MTEIHKQYVIVQNVTSQYILTSLNWTHGHKRLEAHLKLN